MSGSCILYDHSFWLKQLELTKEGLKRYPNDRKQLEAFRAGAQWILDAFFEEMKRKNNTRPGE